MARGRPNVGTRFKPTASQKARQKKASKTTKNLISAPFAVAGAVSREVSKQKKAAPKSTREPSISARDWELIEEARIEREAQAEKERLELEAKKAEKAAAKAEKAEAKAAAKAAKAEAREKAKAEGGSRRRFPFFGAGKGGNDE